MGGGRDEWRFSPVSFPMVGKSLPASSLPAPDFGTMQCISFPFFWIQHDSSNTSCLSQSDFDGAPRSHQPDHASYYAPLRTNNPSVFSVCPTSCLVVTPLAALANDDMAVADKGGISAIAGGGAMSSGAVPLVGRGSGATLRLGVPFGIDVGRLAGLTSIGS